MGSTDQHWVTAVAAVGIVMISLLSIGFAAYCYKKKGSDKTQDIIKIMKAMQDNKEAKKTDVDVVVEPKTPGYDIYATPAASNGNNAAPVSEDKGFPATETR